jgi:predicted NACHT family NTPase
MSKRSLQASSEGMTKARLAFKRKGWTQEVLAGEVGLETRQPIWKFFAGKPVDRQVFHEICKLLEINPQEIVDTSGTPNNSVATSPSNSSPNAIPLRGKTSYPLGTPLPNANAKAKLILQEKIQHQCGTLRLLDIARPLALEDIYVDINILEEISSQRWLEIKDLQKLTANDFSSFGLSKIPPEPLLGLEVVVKYPKLMVLGKPGYGKTTFLQAIAINCSQGKILSEKIPIFISLKSFAEYYQNNNSCASLFGYIYHEYVNCQIVESELVNIFQTGQALILLDSLDEVPEENSDKIIAEINSFTNKFYKNKIIITCRIAAKSYKFKDFTEVEIADLSKQQITTFAYQWFVAAANTSFVKGKSLAEQFINKLELPENLQIRELATTPLLLSITCLVFNAQGDFPKLRFELYKQSIELLLVRWDETRGIKRDEIYRNLSLLHKIKLLSHVASACFVEENYFFSETKVQQLISNYLQNIPQSPTDSDALLLDSHAILKAIEAQHGLLVERARGIYSFSHLTFQEYLTARDIVAKTDSHSLEELVTHIYNKRWREVFLLTTGMLRSPDKLLELMKLQIDNIIVADSNSNSKSKLTDIFDWIRTKSEKITTSQHPAAVRAFYFTLALPHQHPLTRNQSLALSLDSNLAVNLAPQMSLDMALAHALAVALTITPEICDRRLNAMRLAIELEYLLLNNETLNNDLSDLYRKLPDIKQDKKTIKSWWINNGDIWIEALRAITIKHLQIGYDWQLNQHECSLLEQYWNANQLLIDCLNVEGNLTSQIRKSIEENLFLI